MSVAERVASAAAGSARDARFAEVRRLIADARQAGLTLVVTGGDLRHGDEFECVSSELRSRLATSRADVIAELARPRFSTAVRSSAAVRLPGYWFDWWSEMNVNQLLANATHMAWRLRGARCAGRFLDAVTDIIPRHSLLNAKITRYGDLLQIDPAAGCAIVRASCVDQPGALARASEIVWAPLRDGEVFRPFMVEISPHEVICGFVLHHLVADFYACHLLARELSRRLFRSTQGAEAPGEHWLEYSEYVRARSLWEEGPGGRYRLAYWSAHLVGAPAVRLPGAADLVVERVVPYRTIEFALDEELRTRLTAVATRSATTLAQVLLAANFVTLGALLQQTDLLVTVIVSGRDDPALLKFIGNAADCLPVRLEVQRDQSFACLLEQLKTVYALACRYRVKWELVLQSLTITGAPIVAPTFNFVSGVTPARSPGNSKSARGGLPVEAVRLERPAEHGSAARQTSHEMNLFDTGRGVSGHVKYMPARHRTATVEVFVQRFLECLERVTTHAELPVAQLV